MKTKLMALEEVKNPISESDRGNLQNIMVLVDAYADTSVVNGIRSGWAQMARASIQAELLQQFYTTPQKPAAAAIPAGWQLVPIEPTREMCAAAVKYANGDAVYKNVAAAVLEIEEGIYGEAYSAMLAAAPGGAA